MPVQPPATYCPNPDTVVTIRPFSNDEKQQLCQALLIQKSAKARHVYQPYNLDCSLLQQPQVTSDCGGGGDCLYR